MHCTVGILMVLVAAMAPPTVGAPPAGDLRVVVEGLRHDRGRVLIALFDSEAGFAPDGVPVRVVDVAPQNGRASWVFTALPDGAYAVRAFHDENGNHQLDTNFLGIPQEPYGFSNNARATFGFPSYEQARFAFDAGSVTIEITLH